MLIELKIVHTAGNAKNEMAKTEKQDATIFPIQVLGTVSPYLKFQPIRMRYSNTDDQSALGITQWWSP